MDLNNLDAVMNDRLLQLWTALAGDVTTGREQMASSLYKQAMASGILGEHGMPAITECQSTAEFAKAQADSAELLQ